MECYNTGICDALKVNKDGSLTPVNFNFNIDIKTNQNNKNTNKQLSLYKELMNIKKEN